MLKYLKNESLEEVVKEGTVLVDFYADWCGPCQSLATELEDIANNDSNIEIVKINVDERDDLAYQHRVMSIPALFLYKDGNIIKTHVGYANKEEILSWLK